MSYESRHKLIARNSNKRKRTLEVYEGRASTIYIYGGQAEVHSPSPARVFGHAQTLHDIVIVSEDNAGAPAELPPALLAAIEDLYDRAHENLEATEIARGEKHDSYQELKKAILEYGAPALRACRKYLYAVLPDGRNDELLIEWGFEPWDMPVAHKPEDQKFVMHEYDPATDMVKLRLEEDVLADEFIIEAAKTPTPAPPGWVPAQFDTFATSDEPFFELGPLTENMTFAFRGRAKNSAGYGGYSEIWVEVV